MMHSKPTSGAGFAAHAGHDNSEPSPRPAARLALPGRSRPGNDHRDHSYGRLAGMKEQVPALRMMGLHKAFRETVAVDHVDLTVPSGSFFGLVGPNGAGKTTALLMAVGLLRPDAGRSEVLGVDVQADPMRARQLMGVLPDGLAMPERLTGRELLTLIGEMRGLDPDVIAQRTQDLLEVMGLTGAERTLIVDYSTGMRKKIGLATALLHAPRLLVLDEPFEALTPYRRQPSGDSDGVRRKRRVRRAVQPCDGAGRATVRHRRHNGPRRRCRRWPARRGARWP